MVVEKKICVLNESDNQRRPSEDESKLETTNHEPQQRSTRPRNRAALALLGAFRRASDSFKKETLASPCTMKS